MSLQVWLPLNGDLHNQGLSDLTVTPVGTVAYDNAGKIGKCFISGGTSQVANGVNLNTNLVDILNSSAGSSIALWVKPVGNHYHYNGTFISSGDWNSTCWSFGVSQDNSQVDMLCKGHSQYITCAVPVNTWTHLVCTFKDGISKLYKNGAYVGQVTDKAAFASNASNTCIGRETYASGYFGFNGRINDVRIYDHALSPKEVEEIAKGLVLHYKIDDRFCEATTNLYSTLDGVSTSCYNGSNNKYGYGSNSDVYKTTGTFNGRQSLKVYMGTSGNSARPYPYFSNLLVSDGTNAPAYKTLSFDYYGTIGTYLNFYKLGSGSGTGTWKNITNNTSGNFTNSGNIAVTINKWQHIELTLHGTTNANAEWGYCILGDTHTSNTSNYWLFANIQLEAKDHATGFAGYGATRSPTTIYDSSGYSNNGTIVGSLTAAAGSPRYGTATQFASSTITLSPIFFDDTNQCHTVSVWVYPTSTANSTLINFNSGYYLFYGSGGRTLMYLNSGTNDSYVYGSVLPTNTWTFITWVLNTANQTCKVYYNGVLNASSSNYTSSDIPSGVNKNLVIGSGFAGKISDIRIYATALTDGTNNTPNQIKELYETSMSIDSSGNIHARELKEV